MPFNPNRPYGNVHNLNGVAYEQDGRLYNSRGERVGFDGEPLPDEPAPKQAKAAAPKPKPPAPTKTVNVAGFDVPQGMLNDGEDTIVEGVNLSAYGRGEEKVPFFKLKAVIEKEYGVKVTNGPEVREVLIREGVIEPDAEAA